MSAHIRDWGEENGRPKGPPVRRPGVEDDSEPVRPEPSLPPQIVQNDGGIRPRGTSKRPGPEEDGIINRPDWRGGGSGGLRDWGQPQRRGPEVDSSFQSSLAPPVRRVSAYNFPSTISSGATFESSSASSPPPASIQSGPKSLVSIPENMGVEVTLDSYPPPPVRHQSSRRVLLHEKSLRDGSSNGSTRTRLNPGDVSLYQGQEKGVRISVVRSSNGAPVQFSDESSVVSFQPKRLIDIENGKSLVVTREEFLDSNRYQRLDSSGAIKLAKTAPLARPDDYIQSITSLEDKLRRGDIRDFRVNSEVGVMGGMWRAVLRRLMVLSRDPINGLQLTRALQVLLPFLTSYESYVLAQTVYAFDQERKQDIVYMLKVAFRNRNASRFLVQTVGPRYDFVWHWSTQVKYNRAFDAWGQFPIVGITGFPGTENFPSTRDHALASIFRHVLGQGNWLTRVVTGREGLVTDDPEATAQNLAAESNGFELANRNQFGTYVGRRKTDEFRFAHRLTIDESIVRSFVASPMSTMVNNGVVHVLRQLAKHWKNMLNQPSGNFAHQRMEQVNPFETLRFHMPIVLVTLSSLRGRNRWDSEVLGPFIKRLQQLKPSNSADPARYLISEMQDNIVANVSGGIAPIVDPLSDWLDAMHKSCFLLEKEARQVNDIVASVDIGIRLGYDLITQVDWKVQSDSQLKEAILKHIRGEPTDDVSEKAIVAAMTLITPRDKRLLVELVQGGHGKSRPAQLLLGRAKTLLQRELRREILNQTIRKLSKGDTVTNASDVVHDDWYWLKFQDGSSGVYIYDAKKTGDNKHRFIHVDTKFELFVSIEETKIKKYVPVAEAISRAQRAFMNIELHHGKKFTYVAFTEFTFLRAALRRLIVLAQVTCEELDNARLNLLAEIQRSNQAQVSIHDLEAGKTYYTYDGNRKEYVPFVCKKFTKEDPEWERLARTKVVKVPPQSMLVIGGGPTGLMTAIHCTEAVLMSGGTMRLTEARDAFAQGGATFERAQIVRLDARWIGMLRYHLGTGFEDVYIPASGETDSQLGNTLPTQGFVEITIKDLENMLHVEVSKMWSKNLIGVYTEAKSQYDVKTNTLAKLGAHLKLDDAILRRVNEEGRKSNDYHSWKVVEVQFADSLDLKDLRIGETYGIYVRTRNAVLLHRLSGIDLQTNMYTFCPLTSGPDIKAHSDSLPYVYPKGTSKHSEITRLTVESVKKGSKGGYAQEVMFMKNIKDKTFTIDVGHTHVVEAIGKPHGSKVHFSVTTYEPYGVCCIQGLKISMGMHNFGEKRWGVGLLDDIRSHTDQNTRIVGDFTKMVRAAPATTKMYEYMNDDTDKNWQMHFEKLTVDAGFPELNDFDPVVPKIREACLRLSQIAPSFRRKTLQTRFFETGDNFYLGMEFNREYDKWKNELAADLVAPLTLRASKADYMSKQIEKFKGTLMHHIDRLWYEGVLEVIRTGDVYNPGARHRVPRLYLIDSYVDEELGSFPVGESFRLSDDRNEKYEIVIKQRSQVIVRNVEGYITTMPNSTLVRREGNLTRGPDGNAESKVALATFPVGHYVNHRTARLNDSEKGYIFAFVGDEQATPHFMRYSGLTGACINAMLINNFVQEAVDGVPFIDRLGRYSMETNWSNGEVVQRGTGANYGEDGFLRPGFAYDHGIDYLHSKVIECWESDQDLNHVVSRDWKIKLAASLVPRGMEFNEDFITSLQGHLRKTVFNKFVSEIKADESVGGDTLATLVARGEDIANMRQALDSESYWNEFMSGLAVGTETKQVLEDSHVMVAKRVDQICDQVIDYAKMAYLYNERISSELFNQPKPVDSILDDFAVEAQSFANSLVMSAAFSAGALAFLLVGEDPGNRASAVLAGFNILIAFDTMTSSARYKIRNEEARVIFADEKLVDVMKGVFGLLDQQQQDAIPTDENPFVIDLEEKVEVFLRNAKYYDYEEPNEFNASYQQLLRNVNKVEEVRYFQKLLTSSFLVDEYQVNSYLQENLVTIYKSLEDLLQMLSHPAGRPNPKALQLFNQLSLFRKDLESSLQRGATRFGFLKKRRLAHWDCTVALRYFYSLFCCATSSGGTVPMAPSSTKTLGIVKLSHHVAQSGSPNCLSREVRDLEGFYWATRESDVASLIFVVVFLVFVVSILFTIANIFTIQVLREVAFWASPTSALGAILAVFHLWRKFWILVKLVGTLGIKARNAPTTDDRDNIRKVKRVTWTQIFLTLARFLSSAAAAIALPWSVAVNENDRNGNESLIDGMYPAWIAFGALCAAIGATIFFFIVEYVVRYNLNPKLGEFVCEAFREEIEALYSEMSRPLNTIQTKQVQERETWEYVAREFLHRYRFDAVFAADRFGNILQYIQGGMEPRE